MVDCETDIRWDGKLWDGKMRYYDRLWDEMVDCEMKIWDFEMIFDIKFHLPTECKVENGNFFFDFLFVFFI